MKLNTDRIAKIELYNKGDVFLGLTSTFEFSEVVDNKNKLKPKTHTKATVASNNLPKLKPADNITLVFVSKAGTRYRITTPVLSITKTQFEVYVDDVEELPERRRSFKVPTNEPATVYKSLQDEEGVPAVILNINLGGVLLKSEEKLTVGYIYYLNMLDKALELRIKILRKQNDVNNHFLGYGCQFVEVAEAEEEMLAKHILECQVAERERKKTLEDIGLK